MSSSFLQSTHIQLPQSGSQNLTPAVKIFEANSADDLELQINLWILTKVADPDFHHFINQIQYQLQANKHAALVHYTIFERQ